MSFILDALRKAEDRNRDQHAISVPSGPRVLDEELPEAPTPERQSALTLVLMGAALATAVWWFMKSDTPAPTTTARPAAPTPATTRSEPASAANVTAPTPQPIAVRRDTDTRALDREAQRGLPRPAREPAGASAPAAATPTAATPTRVTPGTVTVLPAGDSNPVGRVEQEALPEYRESVARGEVPIPELHLDMHVYSGEPAKRFVFINLEKYGEGDAIGPDTTIESIEPQGAVINYKGYRFVLRPD